MLEAQDHRVVRLDAFGSDYTADPYVLIASCIGNLAKSDDPTLKETLKNSAIAVGRALLPGLGKAALTIIVDKTVGAGAAKYLKAAIKGAREGEGSAIEKYIKDKFDDHDRQSQAVDSFRDALTTFTQLQNKPVVFIIDELDRCRPDFAVRLVERIKHFFDVPNLVFVLLLNRSQLEAAIRGVYGESVDANAYLAKFVQFFVTLSTPATSGEKGAAYARAYCWELARRNSHPNDETTNQFIDNISELAPVFDLTFRDFERGFILFGIADLRQPQRMALLAYLIALKLRDPHHLHQVVMGVETANNMALKILTAAFERGSKSEYLFALISLLKYRSKLNASIPDDAKIAIRKLAGDGDPTQVIDRTLEKLVKKIDLVVSV